MRMGVNTIAAAPYSRSTPSPGSFRIPSSHGHGLEPTRRKATPTLAHQLDGVCLLSPAEIDALRRIEGPPTEVRAGGHVFREGDHPGALCLLLEGWAYRYKRLSGGRRQIFAVLLPGDICESRSAASGRADHGVCALTSSRVAWTPDDQLTDATREFPRIAEGLWRARLLDESLLRAWLLNLGLRKAPARVAHLFCELACRTRAAGLMQPDESFAFPMTQLELGDSLGLTSVHVNRVLQALRAQGLIDLKNGVLRILDNPSLRKLAGFDERYLIGSPTSAGWGGASGSGPANAPGRL